MIKHQLHHLTPSINSSINLTIMSRLEFKIGYLQIFIVVHWWWIIMFPIWTNLYSDWNPDPSHLGGVMDAAWSLLCSIVDDANAKYFGTHQYRRGRIAPALSDVFLIFGAPMSLPLWSLPSFETKSHESGGEIYLQSLARPFASFWAVSLAFAAPDSGSGGSSTCPRNQ